MIAAGIVLYNPDEIRLAENIASVKHQFDNIILYNNGPTLSDSISEICQGCIIIGNKGNVGIAAALNAICDYADTNFSADWILTLDQDSICPSNLSKEYGKFLDLPNVAMLCPEINDRNFGIMAYDAAGREEFEEVESCITSASLLKISIWREIGGFWEDLFIDMVDFDICWSIHERGYKIYRINSVSLTHEIGHGRLVRFRGQDAVAYNHAPIRDYYIARNNILVGKKHGKLNQCFRWGLKRFLIIMRFEGNRPAKMWHMLKGLIHGLLGISG